MRKTKEEIEEELNNLLGVDVKWSKLTMDELQQIQNALRNVDVVGLLLVKVMRGRVKGRINKIIDILEKETVSSIKERRILKGGLLDIIFGVLHGEEEAET